MLDIIEIVNQRKTFFVINKYTKMTYKAYNIFWKRFGLRPQLSPSLLLAQSLSITCWPLIDGCYWLLNIVYFLVKNYWTLSPITIGHHLFVIATVVDHLTLLPHPSLLFFSQLSLLVEFSIKPKANKIIF